MTKTRIQRRLPRLAASFLLILATFEADAGYPGNANFRNVGVINTATTRTDWVTNVTHIITESTNPGYAAPVDWDTYSRPLAPGVDHIPTILTTAGGWPTNMVCHMLRINLTTPGLRFTGTDRCPEGWGEDMPESISKKSNGTYYKKRTVREKTSDFLARNRGAKSLGGKERDARIAFNLAAWLPWTSPYTNLWAEPYSPLYSDGKSVSFSEVGGVANAKGDTVPQSMIVIYKDGTAELINSITAEKAKKIWFCAPAFVAEIVSAGQVPGHAMQIDPRTAMGISQDRKTLYLFFCDGRISNWSGGCYWSSLSTLLQAMGSWYAINLDGGGSSTFCVWDENSAKPMVFNRPSGGSLRDNGSNAAIYYKLPDATLGTWLYDDFDFLMQDIIDGETPDGVTDINVLGDATFTADHPCVPATGYTICSTNNATIGWETGVTPQVASGTRVAFRNIRFRAGSRALSVASGGTAVLAGGVDLDEISTQDSAGLVLSGALPGTLRVTCATATAPGDVFATSTMSLAETSAQLGSIVCGGHDDFVAVATESDGAVSLSWERPLDFGGSHGFVASSRDRATVTVNVADAKPEVLPAGSLLKLTVTSEDGRRTSVQSVAFTGAGTYTFRTEESSNPTICANGYTFTYTVELTDSTGTRIPNVPTIGGRMGLGVEAPWFAAAAASDSATGGQWRDKPVINDEMFAIDEEADGRFDAVESRGGRIRLETVAIFHGAITRKWAATKLEEISAMETKPLGAAFVIESADDDETPVWCGLVREDGAPAFRELRGPVAIDIPCTLVQEVDWSSGAPLVSYLASTNGTDLVRLSDASGATWFDSVSTASAASGRVEFTGVGRVASFAGTSVKRAFPPVLIIVR